MGGTGENLPFWMHSNNRGRIGKESNLLGVTSLLAEYSFYNGSTLSIGAGVFSGDQLHNEIAVDQAYVEFKNNWFKITAGAKQQPEIYNGLSGTNNSILHSLNARPFPGLKVATAHPLMIVPGIGFEAEWAEYLLEEDRLIPWTRVHQKSLHLVLQPSNDWEITAGLLHFAQWGGTSPEWGEQPAGPTDYLKIVTGRHGGEAAIETERQNSLGNHLGSWELNVRKQFEFSSVEFIYNSIFEDGSGSRLANFPDGRYGIFWKSREEEGFLSALMYEFYYTKDQSQTGPHLYDQYFNSYLYRSGWTYHEKVIGAPFFLYDKEVDQIINNKFIVHHLGISGNILTPTDIYPYRFLLSYAQNEGTYGRSLFPSGETEKKLSLLFHTRLYNSLYENFQIDLHVAADYSNMAVPNYAAGVRLKYEML
ncbi:capsule assembly Wzi family protein [Salinimicrobium terrae]|uniref:capsule assembly Wzi family protein n=1 Tax=Salinimicrobium terrae TaxID=470866 RepID=UPI000418E60A|nr:capsule assembly Wzi family protein [Salinimicrobium terrae]